MHIFMNSPFRETGRGFFYGDEPESLAEEQFSSRNDTWKPISLRGRSSWRGRPLINTLWLWWYGKTLFAGRFVITHKFIII